MTTAHDLSTVDLPLDEVRTYEHNPRRGDIPAIAASLKANGQFAPIVVNRGTYTGRAMEVLAGNHTVLAAQKLGWSSLSAVVLDVDEEAGRRIVLAANRTHDLGTYDLRALAEILRGVDDPTGTGYDRDAIGRILAAPIPLVGDYTGPRVAPAETRETPPRNDPAVEWAGMEPAGGLVGFSERPVRSLTIHFWTEDAVRDFERYAGLPVGADLLSMNLPNKHALEASAS